MEKSTLPLQAISYLQKLANGNPKLVAQSASFFYTLRDQYDSKKISLEKYRQEIDKYILSNS
jgi:hypothetical protein